MAVFRAVETRRAMVRVANTGISGFIGPTGQIHKPTGLFEATAIRQAVPMISIKTNYVRVGDLFAKTCLGILLLWVGYRFSMSRIRPRNDKISR